MEIWQQVTKYRGKEDKLFLRSKTSSFPQYFQYISNFRCQITNSFVKCGCSIYLFSSILQIWYVEVRIFRSVPESPLEIEITRGDCICCPHEESLHPWLSKMHQVKILFRLCECAGWSMIWIFVLCAYPKVRVAVYFCYYSDFSVVCSKRGS